MKRILAVALIIACYVEPAVVYAATKCVPLGTGTSCSQADLSTLSYSTDWSTSCSNSNNNNEEIDIYGIAACSSSSGTFGSTSSRISTGRTASDTDPTSTNDNKYCWCRIIRPGVSDWMFLANYSTASNCHFQCAIACGESIAGSSTISLYGTLY